jgi:hypothetical protein
VHWFSTDAFLATFSEVYFPGEPFRIADYRVAGRTYRLLAPGGRPPVTSWTFFDFLVPVEGSGPAEGLRGLPHAALGTIPLGEERPAMPPDHEPAPFIRWERFPDWPAFEAHFVRRRSSLPRDSRQKRRNIEKDIGPFRFAWEDGRSEVFDQCFAWKSAQYDRTGVADHFAVERNREIFRRLHAKGHLVVSTLSGGDQLLAVHFGALADGCLYSWIAAYDPARGRYSPGRLLLEDMLRESFSRGHREWDFGIGESEYKWFYASDCRVIGAVGTPSLAAMLGSAVRARFKPLLARHPAAFETARRARKRLLDARNALRGGRR